ncbi:ABC transporter substrate-binding protein [Actinotignum urinale]|uniref:ABC transporter substrate-binding protein n=1 Tax=Actinotignum urinale TaxID=190146 RepID=UPI002A80DA24|nr:ABC transporter substrate-binding protein [Actinotignum urinale]MDY5129211.1 ABC transporter substrate-binding protein [Actinotignum urinale]
MKKIAGLSFLIVAALSFAGCSGSSPTSQGPADTNATVHVGFRLETGGLNPTTTGGAAFRQLGIDNVYEGLTRVNQQGEVVPSLAKKWDVSDDGLKYTFHLQKGVKFHDGSDFDSEDVVASLKAATAPDSKNPGAKSLKKVKDITAEGKETVVVTLNERDTTLLDSLGNSAGMIIPSDNNKDLNKESNGTGPYTFGEWKTGDSVTLKRNDNYWGKKAKTKEVVYHYYKDQKAAADALASGQIDILTASDNDTKQRFANDAKFKHYEGNDTSWMTLGFNHKNPALANDKVRHAIRQAIDKDGLVKALGGDIYRVGSMVVPDTPQWSDSLTQVDPYNIEEAKKLLNEAGVKDLKLNLRVANTYDSAMSEYIAAQLKKIGVDVKIDTMEFSTWMQDVYKGGNYDMTIVLHVDPWTILNYGNPKYYWNYGDAKSADFVKEATGAKSIKERDEKLAQLATHISEDAASDWLYARKCITYAREGVSGFPTNRTVSRFYVPEIEVATTK